MHHTDLQSTTDTILKEYPILGFLLCVSGTIVSAILTTSVTHMELPLIVMQLGQVIAWIFVYITGAITIINALEKWFDFKFSLKKLFKKNKDKEDTENK